MTDPVRTGEAPSTGKGKAPHLPVGKGHTDEENRRAMRAGGHPDAFPAEKDLVDLSKTARSVHDQPPGGFRKGVPGRFTFVDEDAQE